MTSGLSKQEAIKRLMEDLNWDYKIAEDYVSFLIRIGMVEKEERKPYGTISNQ